MMNAQMEGEIREARAAGIRALNSLRRAEKLLDSARSWGMLDMLGGGGIVGMLKHIRLDDAREALDAARRDLIGFRRELGDVEAPEIDVDGFLTFADFFFDGLLADFMVQRRVNEARVQVARACEQVEAALRGLR